MFLIISGILDWMNVVLLLVERDFDYITLHPSLIEEETGLQLLMLVFPPLKAFRLPV